MQKKQLWSEYLKQLRKSRGYKQKDIAALLHISRQSYSHYETGRSMPSITVLYYIAKIYGLSVDTMLKDMEIGETELQIKEVVNLDVDKGNKKVSEQEFFACLYSLNEKNRRTVFSIMWEIMQAKKKQEEIELHEISGV